MHAMAKPNTAPRNVKRIYGSIMVDSPVLVEAMKA
jgi:hypothetical protein